MRMIEWQKVYHDGGVLKKPYWTLMRENYTHILPEIQELLADSSECEGVSISKDSCILTKKNGVKIFFDFTETMCRAEAELVMGEDYEKEGMNYINSHLSKRKCKTVLDIGANVGMFSLDLYTNHPNIVYHVFEPIPMTFERLNKTAVLNCVDPDKYIMHNIGFSNQKGEFDFYLPAQSTAASLQMITDEFYTRQSTQTGEYTGEKEVEKVACIVDTLDSFVEEHNINDIGFIKIDVEGNEKFVLEGARKSLLRDYPLIYCELLRKHAKRFGYHPNDVIQYMRELGYDCFTIRNHDIVKIESIDENTEEMNFIFDRMQV